jgi:hypothetical protein
MVLPEKAAAALAVVRRDGQDVRFEVKKGCEDPRYRLSVRYRSREGNEIRLGLLYSEDRASLLALLDKLRAETPPAGGASA